MRVIRFKGYGKKLQRKVREPKPINLKYAQLLNRTFVIQNFTYTHAKLKRDDFEDEIVSDGDYEELVNEFRAANNKQEQVEREEQEEISPVGSNDVELQVAQHRPQLKLRHVSFMKDETNNIKSSKSATILHSMGNESVLQTSKVKHQRIIAKKMVSLQANNTIVHTSQKSHCKLKSSHVGTILHLNRCNSNSMPINKFMTNSSHMLKTSKRESVYSPKAPFSFRVKLNRR